MKRFDELATATLTASKRFAQASVGLADEWSAPRGRELMGCVLLPPAPYPDCVLAAAGGGPELG
ncbi:hypothetical protein [Curtobacterium sp. MCJR17_043]|uniref:hypothetical protein n=1 Tax=Curtobacterium sp. MCJR17_043 TaxID=2175660 RepID=UPI0024DF82AF|nr:hypothetical protein [Curtobacterium sp. MCJR17_043]WIB36265.1 hypothetical protein DEJ15_03525 [Curtobacterium sp. MCJR17_043]